MQPEGKKRFLKIFITVLLLLILTAASAVVNRFAAKRVRLQLTLPMSAGRQTAVTAKAGLINDSKFPVLRAFCVLRLVNDLTLEAQQTEVLLSAGAGRASEADYLLESGHCGRLELSAVSVRLMDFFGIIPAKVQTEAVARMTVLPELFSSEVTLHARSADSEEGAADRKGEDRSEIFQLREYVPGDDVRQIHWKLSSKLDQLILKEPSEPVSRSVLVFWDKRKPASPDRMDALADAVSSVCQGICDSGIPFTLCWTEEDLQAEEITGENELLSAVPALVKTVGNPECPLPEMAEYSLVLYFAAELPEEDCPDKVAFLLCGSEEPASDRAFVFAPDTAAEELARLEV